MKLLLIEDDLALCRSLKPQLEKEGFSVDLCHDGEEGLFYVREQAHDLVLLDRMLPGMDGLSLLKQIRKEKLQVPVIFLTALGGLDDRISGLDCGADDYIMKPFAFGELMARIRCIFRRPPSLTDLSLLSYGDLSLQTEQSLLCCGQKSCSLSPRESALLGLFLRNPEQVLPRSTLLSRVWGPDAEVEDGNLDNYIHFLRRRLKSLHSSLKLKTVRGVGYCLSLQDSSD
ncbi:MAG TPA: response regulator transcription factor [Candidatus Choladousia intestinavium]|uniref:Stage 0 sporulation protein A homolog n=1 Tax=Candidatus Choladousia intestinavium TaxID=2840727 RepID=A0A9D1AEB5_9FIRM|nr:response regulator transcription factor [Candidatus Choladousia intestinavium]